MSKKIKEINIPKKIYILSFTGVFFISFLKPLIIFLLWYHYEEMLIVIPIIVGLILFLVWNFYGVSELKAEHKKKKDFNFDLTKKIKRLLLLLMCEAFLIALIMGLIVLPTIS